MEALLGQVEGASQSSIVNAALRCFVAAMRAGIGAESGQLIVSEETTTGAKGNSSTKARARDGSRRVLSD